MKHQKLNIVGFAVHMIRFTATQPEISEMKQPEIIDKQTYLGMFQRSVYRNTIKSSINIYDAQIIIKHSQETLFLELRKYLDNLIMRDTLS